MFYILLNSLGLILSGSFGILIKNKIKEKQINAVYKVVAILVLVIALQGVIEMENFILITLSLFFGTLIGSGLQIEDRIIEKANSLMANQSSNFINGVISIVLVTCMGSLAILGPLNIALKSDPTIMNFKTILDTVMSLAFGTMYGKSIFPAALVLFIYQMIFYILGNLIAPLLTETVILYIGQIGSLILIALSFNMLDLTEIKIMDLTPAIIFPIIFYFITNLLPGIS